MRVALSQVTNLCKPTTSLTHERNRRCNTKTCGWRVLQCAGRHQQNQRINALRKLTKETGCGTRRTQSLILGTLTPNELTAVAETLALQPDVPRG